MIAIRLNTTVPPSSRGESPASRHAYSWSDSPGLCARRLRRPPSSSSSDEPPRLKRLGAAQPTSEPATTQDSWQNDGGRGVTGNWPNPCPRKGPGSSPAAHWGPPPYPKLPHHSLCQFPTTYSARASYQAC
eukprot:2288103-Rhodomonas_salina.5